MDTLKLDADLIDSMGGSTKVAQILTDRRARQTPPGRPVTPQVVSNWKVRGISDAARVEWPDLFLRVACAAEPTAPAGSVHEGTEGGAA